MEQKDNPEVMPADLPVEPVPNIVDTNPIETEIIPESIAPIADKDNLASDPVAIETEAVQEEKEIDLPLNSIKKGMITYPAYNRYGLIASFLVPILIMIAIFIERGIFPFGESSFLRTDMYHQYAPFFSDFRNKLVGGGSLLHSWDMGMGINFTALYSYYLASPLNWLVILCPKGFIIEFLTYLIVFKIGLSGLTFAYYISKHCKTKPFGIAFFGIFYALSGYMAAYSWNIMWLDCILLLPLIVLGLERLVKKNRGFLYCITLGLSILSNYYISIMICIFMVFYFIALLIMEEKRHWRCYLRNFLQFSLYSLLAGGLAAAVLLPEIYALQVTASGDFDFPQTVTSYFSIFDMMARHMVNVETEIGLNHWPNIYCGIAVLLLFPLYIINTKVKLKEKAVYCFLLLFFFASFSTNVLNFIWHGFHFPNSLPGRQSFIYIFLLLFMCFKAYKDIHNFSWRAITGVFWGAVIFVLLAQKLVDNDQFHFSVFYITILLLALYTGLIYLYQNPKLSYITLLTLTLALVAVEAAMNTTITSVSTTNRTAYLEDNESITALVESVESDTDFFRFEKLDGRTKNDGAWSNFSSASLFSSTANAALTDLFKSLGCESSTNAYSITGATPFISSLFSIRYLLSPSELTETQIMDFSTQVGETYLYKNRYTLPIGFTVPDDLESKWDYNSGTPVDVQNSLAKAIGAEDVLLEAESTTSGNTFRFTPHTDGEYYVYVTNKTIETATVTIGSLSKTFSNIDRGYLLELGYCESGVEVVIRGKEENDIFNANAYLFSYDSFISAYHKFNKTPFEVLKYSDKKIVGNISVDEKSTLFTSIPYDTGWTVLIDDVPQETNAFADTFLSLTLDPGEHTITFLYYPEGLSLGIGITLISISILLLIDMNIRIQKYKKLNTRRRQQL